MKKHTAPLLFWSCLLFLSIIFVLCALLLHANFETDKEVLLFSSTLLMAVSLIALSVSFVHYLDIKEMLSPNTHVLAHWSYSIHTSPTLCRFLSIQKSNTHSTAILSYILGLIFSFIFAYSGGVYVLYTGYTLAFLATFIFFISLYIIHTYYKNALYDVTDVIFTEQAIYFMNERFTFQKSIFFLEEVKVTRGPECLLEFIYGQYDIDSDPAYILSIPIPADKLEACAYLCTYYNNLIAAQKQDY